MRRNARIRWPGSEFKSSHRGRRSKEVRNIGKLFNRTAICLNINFNKNLSKANSPSSRENFPQDYQPGKEIEPATSYYAPNTDLRQYQTGPWSREDTCSLSNGMPCLRVTYTAAVLRLHTAQQSLTYHSISSDLAQYQTGPCLRESKDLISLTSTFSTFNFLVNLTLFQNQVPWSLQSPSGC